MKRFALFDFGLGSFIVAPLLLLLLLLFFHWDGIERKVAANANDSLAVKHAWARAETFNRGRDAIIIGTAPHQQAADDSVDTVLTAPGVRRASFAGNISPPLAAARVDLVFEADEIIFKGALASRASINNLVAIATGSFSPRKIINQLEVVENAAATRDLAAVFEASKALRSGIKLNLAGSTLTVSGEMPDEQSRRSLVQKLSENFEGKVVDELHFTPVDPNEVCQNKLNGILATSKINFRFQESDINRGSFTLLNNLANILRNCQAVLVQVAGHTDSIGTPESNILLSQQRATSVINYFTEFGLDPDRFEVIGYGQNKPVADNRTAAGRAENRRIEFLIKI